MIRILADMWRTPGAEADPEAWATRFAAHMGLSAGVMIVLMAVMPALPALALSLAAYAVWEATQWYQQRSWLVWWDCVLDWCAWASMALAVAFSAWGGAWAAVGLIVATLAIAWSGVWQRSPRRGPRTMG